MKSLFDHKKSNTNQLKSLFSDPRWLLLGLAALLFAGAVAYEYFVGATGSLPVEASKLLP